MLLQVLCLAPMAPMALAGLALLSILPCLAEPPFRSEAGRSGILKFWELLGLITHRTGIPNSVHAKSEDCSVLHSETGRFPAHMGIAQQCGV